MQNSGSFCILQFMFTPGAKCATKGSKHGLGEQKEGWPEIGACLREAFHHCHQGWLLLQPFTGGEYRNLFPGLMLYFIRKVFNFSYFSLHQIRGSQYRTRFNFSYNIGTHGNIVKSGIDQVMIGPVPCVLAHDILYMELREILYQRGRVVTMFLHKVSQFSLFVLDWGPSPECDQAEGVRQAGQVRLRSVRGQGRGAEAYQARQPRHRQWGWHQNFPHGQELVRASAIIEQSVTHDQELIMQ